MARVIMLFVRAPQKCPGAGTIVLTFVGALLEAKKKY